MPKFNIPPRKEGIHIQMPKADLEMVLAMLRNPANAALQGKTALFMKDGPAKGYCCLGAMQCAKTGGFVEHTGIVFHLLPGRDWLDSVGWTFFNKEGGRCSNPYLPLCATSAADANDNSGYSFSQIADAIEACAEGY